ncbi:MAG: activator of Hsp90 ATPase 1-like protein [Rhodoglobus sp.]|nr:activator of Hsp90 ATPase 1-like protein [Rhodoglobus sp.]
MSDTIERIIAAPRERVWELWTTGPGIEKWWAPDGFRTDVDTLDLTPGGDLVYTMTAVAPEQVAFMEQYGMPLSNVSRKTFTEIDEPGRLAYRSIVDFVPDHEPYEQLTEIVLEEVDGGTRVVMTVEAMHDEVWTQRLLEGRANELDNLAKIVSAE